MWQIDAINASQDFLSTIQVNTHLVMIIVCLDGEGAATRGTELLEHVLEVLGYLDRK